MLRWMVVAIALVISGGAQAQSYVAFGSDANGEITFVMPSGNVACIFIPEGGTDVYMPPDGGPELSCDRAAPTYLRFTLRATGAAEVTDAVGDPSCCGGSNTFAYDRMWRAPPFTCTSARTGLNCTNDEGHGFVINRASPQAY